MTIARSEGEEKSRSAFTHIGDRDRIDGPLSITFLLLLSEAVVQRLSCNSSLIHPPPTAPRHSCGSFAHGEDTLSWLDLATSFNPQDVSF